MSIENLRTQVEKLLNQLKKDNPTGEVFYNSHPYYMDVSEFSEKAVKQITQELCDENWDAHCTLHYEYGMDGGRCRNKNLFVGFVGNRIKNPQISCNSGDVRITISNGNLPFEIQNSQLLKTAFKRYYNVVTVETPKGVQNFVLAKFGIMKRTDPLHVAPLWVPPGMDFTGTLVSLPLGRPSKDDWPEMEIQENENGTYTLFIDGKTYEGLTF